MVNRLPSLSQFVPKSVVLQSQTRTPSTATGSAGTGPLSLFQQHVLSLSTRPAYGSNSAHTKTVGVQAAQHLHYCSRLAEKTRQNKFGQLTFVTMPMGMASNTHNNPEKSKPSQISNSRGLVTLPPGPAINVEQKLKDWESEIDIEQLTDSHKIIHNCHMKAVKNKQEAYEDPVTGFEVFTILSHLKRGTCCGNICRHCPYKHINAPSKFRDVKYFNTCFYA